MGCSSCTKKEGGDGCDARKVPQRAALDELIDRIYPNRTWGQPDDEARFGAGVRPSEATRFAQALAVVTKAPTFVRAGADEDLCTFVYALCLGRTPCLLELREGRAAADLASADGHGFGVGEERIHERYLRVALSTAARLATVQEVAMEGALLSDGSLEIRELPRAGVYDKILLKRMRATVDLLLASDLLHIDFGLIDKPLADADESVYKERYGAAPHLVNYLFYAAPPLTSSVTLV